MRLVIELEPDRYEAVASGEGSILDGRLDCIEVRQVGGLLSTEFAVVGIAAAGANVDLPGLGEGSGLRVRVWCAQKEVSD